MELLAGLYDRAPARETLRTLIERFGRADSERPWPTHPKFGALSGKDWGVLGYRHLDHHLRQFGH